MMQLDLGMRYKILFLSIWCVFTISRIFFSSSPTSIVQSSPVFLCTTLYADNCRLHLGNLAHHAPLAPNVETLPALVIPSFSVSHDSFLARYRIACLSEAPSSTSLCRKPFWPPTIVHWVVVLYSTCQVLLISRVVKASPT